MGFWHHIFYKKNTKIQNTPKTSIFHVKGQQRQLKNNPTPSN
jgi:hypothetical protein